MHDKIIVSDKRRICQAAGAIIPVSMDVSCEGVQTVNKKENIELRYYEIPQDPPLIALLGERWVLNYGSDPMHFHNFMEIGYCYYGEGNMLFGKERKTFSDGTITVIPANCPHRTKSRDDSISKWEYIYIDTDRFMEKVFGEKPIRGKSIKDRLVSRVLLLQGEEVPVISSLIRFILDEMRSKSEFYKEHVQGLLYSLIIEIARLNPQPELEEVMVTDAENNSNIIDVIQYVGEHYNEDLKMSDLAEIGHMSESHFRRVFVSCMNVPPLTYVNLVRIQKACDILAASEDSLEQTGQKVGFPVFETFCRNFKKIIGITPKEWRNMVRERENCLVNYNVSIHKGW